VQIRLSVSIALGWRAARPERNLGSRMNPHDNRGHPVPDPF
jgi:hypothetical protein